MKIQSIVWGVAMVIVAGMFSPATSLAYTSTAQHAERVSDTHVLFSITFKAGFLNRAAEVPFFAIPESTESNVFALRYKIHNEEDKSNPNIKTQGFILPKAHTAFNASGQYSLPYGRDAYFVLYVIAEIPKNSTEKYALSVTSLPFLATDTDGSHSLISVDSGTLKDYKTPSI